MQALESRLHTVILLLKKDQILEVNKLSDDYGKIILQCTCNSTFKKKKKKHLYARDPQMFLSVINMDMSEYHKLSECYDWVKVLHSIMHYEKHSLNS